MNKISGIFGGIGTQNGMVFFTILIIGMSFLGGIMPSTVQAYIDESCCGYDYYDTSYYPSDYYDTSYYGGYDYYDTSSYPSYDYYDTSYYPNYSYSNDPLYNCADGCSLYGGGSYGGGYSYPPSYGGGCGSNCGGGYYIPPRTVTPPPVVYSGGCSYGSGGCGYSTPSYNTSSNYSYSNKQVSTTNVTTIDNSIKDSFNTTIKDSFNTAMTNIQYTIQSQNPFIPQPTCTAYASPSSVSYGGSTTVTWSSSNATSAYLSNHGNVNTSGSYTFSNITNPTTYTVTVTGQNGTTNTCSATVNVALAQVPTCSITYAQPSGSTGNQVLLSWTSSNASSAHISNLGSVSVNGSQYVYPSSNATYYMTVYGINGGTTNNCSVTVPSYYTPPVQQNLYCTLTASPSSIQNGASSLLSWTSYGATSATLSDGLGNVPMSGSLSVRPENSRSYTLTVRDYQGRTNTCYTTVNVSGSYVSLTSIPYTGFDGGPFGNGIYWAGLALWALAAGYIVTRYLPQTKGRSVAHVFNGFASTMAYAAEPVILQERVIAKTPVAEVVAVPVAQKEAIAPAHVPTERRSNDVMKLEVKEGETPRLVINRG